MLDNPQWCLMIVLQMIPMGSISKALASIDCLWGSWMPNKPTNIKAQRFSTAKISYFAEWLFRSLTGCSQNISNFWGTIILNYWMNLPYYVIFASKTRQKVSFVDSTLIHRLVWPKDVKRFCSFSRNKINSPPQILNA